MEGPPPPLGHPWYPNVGHNPLMDRGAAPHSLNHIPGFQAPPPGPPHDAPPAPAAPPPSNPTPPCPPPAGLEPPNQPPSRPPPQFNTQQQTTTTQHNIGPLDVNIHLTPPPPMMGVGMGIGMGLNMGLGFGMGMPFGGMLGGIHSAGPLGVPRDPWNTPGLMGNPSSRYGSTVPGLPGVGFAAADLPPPPPEISNAIPPFAPGVPLWASGGAGGGAAIGSTAFGNMGFGSYALGLAAGYNYPYGFMPSPFDARPAPALLTEATGLPQPKQDDITQIPGGIPPGVTHVESGEHTLMHVLKGPIFPWLNHGMPMEVEMMQMSSVTGVNRLIEILNNNEPAEGMAVSECHEMVNGVWEKGQTFVYGDAMSRVLTLKDAGWDNKRNRTGGQSLHVYLHRI